MRRSPGWGQTESGVSLGSGDGLEVPHVRETARALGSRLMSERPGVQVDERAPPGGQSRHAASPRVPRGAQPEPPP